jgi:hypothetical protein
MRGPMWVNRVENDLQNAERTEGFVLHPTSAWTRQQLREALRGTARHGSCCGIGIGSTARTSRARLRPWGSRKS